MVVVWFLFLLSGLVLVAFSANALWLTFSYLFWGVLRGERFQAAPVAHNVIWPRVTSQIPIYNELNVAERVIRAVASMKYEAGKHQIQILDDSNDGTSKQIERIADELSNRGVDIKIVKRAARDGFKAGALANGLESASGEFIAIFDADFVPGEEFLQSMIQFLLDDQGLGFVQARWDHLNRDSSTLTQVQALAIDGFSSVCQPARSLRNYIVNFNGTAGVWRREAIIEGGNWLDRTLTEDIDLSYRAYMKGWRGRFVSEIAVPAELPGCLLDYKRQQARWARGSIRVAKLMLPEVLRSNLPRATKLQAIFHLGHYVMSHATALFLVACCLFVLFGVEECRMVEALVSALMTLGLIAAIAMYGSAVALRRSGRITFPKSLSALLLISAGLSLSNSIGLLNGILKKSAGVFDRTPKESTTEGVHYRRKWPWESMIEIPVSIFLLWCGQFSLATPVDRLAPLLLFAGIGMLWVGIAPLLSAIPGTRVRSMEGRNPIKRFLKSVQHCALAFAILITVFLVGPVSRALIGGVSVGTPEDKYHAFIHNGSSGIAPSPGAYRPAVVQVYCARAWGYKGAAAEHCWIALKRSQDTSYRVAQIKGWYLIEQGKDPLVFEEDIPDRLWMGHQPTVIADLRGARAEKAIHEIEAAINEYPFRHSYNLWPGPNSNTFVAHIARNSPSLHFRLPVDAIGKDYLGHTTFCSKMPGGPGKQISLLGLIGAGVGFTEGFEIQALGLAARFNLVGRSLELPGGVSVGIASAGTDHHRYMGSDPYKPESQNPAWVPGSTLSHE